MAGHTRNDELASTRQRRHLLQNRISCALESVGKSTRQLAVSAQVPYSTTRRIIRGESDPPLAYALLISRALEVPVGSLFELDWEPAPPQVWVQRLGTTRSAA